MNRSSPLLPETSAATKSVMKLFGLFVLLFVIVVPGYMAVRYGNFWYALDFYRMPMLGGDYLATHSAASRWIAGQSIYTIGDSLGRLYSYPAVHAIIFAPLAALPFESSYQVWSVISGLLILASLGLAASLFPRPWAAFLLGLILTAQSSFILFQFERGQTDALVLFLITLFLFLYLKGYSRYLTAAVFVAAIVIKIFPAIWGLFFLLRREFRLLFAAAAFFVVTIALTDPAQWLYYVQIIVPTYSNYYLGYTVDHSLFYLLDGIIPDHATARRLAQVISVVFIACYSTLVLLNRDRNRSVLLEIALLTIIMEMSTPWAANYKLVLLIFAFLTPLSVLQIEFVAKRPVLFTLPIFACFVLIIPIFGEYLVRIPYTLFALLTPSDFIAANPIDPIITERKVALGLIALLLYLFALYACSTLKTYLPVSWSEKTDNLVHCLARPAVAVGCLIALTISSVSAAYMYNQKSRPLVEGIVAETATTLPMGPALSAIGYQLTPRGSGYSTLDLVYDVLTPLPKNYQIYVHMYDREATGELKMQSGKNFQPDTITSFWPSNKKLAVRTTIATPARFSEIHTGFFDLADGARYGPEAIFLRK